MSFFAFCFDFECFLQVLVIFFVCHCIRGLLLSINLTPAIVAKILKKNANNRDKTPIYLVRDAKLDEKEPFVNNNNNNVEIPKNDTSKQNITVAHQTTHTHNLDDVDHDHNPQQQSSHSLGMLFAGLTDHLREGLNNLKTFANYGWKPKFFGEKVSLIEKSLYISAELETYHDNNKLEEYLSFNLPQPILMGHNYKYTIFDSMKHKQAEYLQISQSIIGHGSLLFDWILLNETKIIDLFLVTYLSISILLTGCQILVIHPFTNKLDNHTCHHQQKLYSWPLVVFISSVCFLAIYVIAYRNPLKKCQTLFSGRFADDKCTCSQIVLWSFVWCYYVLWTTIAAFVITDYATKDKYSHCWNQFKYDNLLLLVTFCWCFVPMIGIVIHIFLALVVWTLLHLLVWCFMIAIIVLDIFCGICLLLFLLNRNCIASTMNISMFSCDAAFIYPLWIILIMSCLGFCLNVFKFVSAGFVVQCCPQMVSLSNRNATRTKCYYTFFSWIGKINSRLHGVIVVMSVGVFVLYQIYKHDKYFCSNLWTRFGSGERGNYEVVVVLAFSWALCFLFVICLVRRAKQEDSIKQLQLMDAACFRIVYLYGAFLVIWAILGVCCCCCRCIRDFVEGFLNAPLVIYKGLQWRNRTATKFDITNI